MPSTEDLVIAARDGDKSAFGQLVRLYERAAIITAHFVVRDWGRAQDATQEAFVTAYTKLNQLSIPAAFGPWLLTIMRRRALLMRRGRHLERLSGDVPSPTSETNSDWLHRYEEVVEQQAQLPEHERLVVVMRYVNGNSVQEIADSVGKPVGTIKKQLSRALQRLRKRLKGVPS